MAATKIEGTVHPGLLFELGKGGFGESFKLRTSGIE